MAADSAVSLKIGDDQKIFTSANKIYALSDYHPVGIMIYGNSTFMGKPWETIIKIYRMKLKKSNYQHLTDYAEDFLKSTRYNFGKYAVVYCFSGYHSRKYKNFYRKEVELARTENNVSADSSPNKR